MADQQAGWYKDPSGDVTKLRYWNGEQWTNDFTDAPDHIAQAGTEQAAPAVQSAPQTAVPEPAPFTPAEATVPETQAAAVTGNEQAYAATTPSYEQAAAAAPSDPYAAQNTAAYTQPANAVGAGQPIPVQSANPAAAGAHMPGQAPQNQMPGQAPAQPYNAAPQQYGSAYPAAEPYQAKKKSKAPLIIGIVVAAIVVVGVIVGVVSMLGGGGTINVNGEDTTGTIGQTYETRWFTCNVESLTTSSSYDGYEAMDGYYLVIAHITEKNVSGNTQPFGTFDWPVGSDDISTSEYLYPLEAFNDEMMPDSFYLDDGEEVSYDVVIEVPDDLDDPYLIYTELSSSGTVYGSIKYMIK